MSSALEYWHKRKKIDSQGILYNIWHTDDCLGGERDKVMRHAETMQMG
jgi:hypothetical protein